jgi:hypothetical protein
VRRRWPLGVGFLVGVWWTPGFTPDASFAVSELLHRGLAGHRAALALVDELLAIGAGSGHDVVAEPVGVSGRATRDPGAVAHSAP